MASKTRAELLADPGTANAEVAAALTDQVEKPVIPLPPADTVRLPGGLVYRGDVYRTVRVQELNGRHEEALARAIQPPPGAMQTNWANFLTVLLECGTVEFSDLDERPKDLLKDTLLGDRDAIILGIRQASYGDEVELRGWQCPSCGGTTDLTISLAGDVEVVTMEDPREETTFEVPLRKGRKATVKLATGRVLAAMWEQDNLNVAERNSVMLTHCLQKITEADGTEVRVAGRASVFVLEMSIPDRRAIVRELEKRQPGPRYNGIKFTHQDCQKEVPLVIGLGDLFPELF
jgi:hypothetical protein